MIELIKFIVGSFAEKPENVTIDTKETGKEIKVTVTLDESDMGKVIGRGGKLAKALRTIVRACTQKESKKYTIEIKERGEVE